MAVVVESASLPDRTTNRIRATLEGRRRGWRAVLPCAGPAVVVSIAYMDPGNFATNIAAGSTYRYALVWAAVLASAIAMLFQAMSANLGIVTNRNLAELCREHFPRPLTLAMWIASEIAAMATDVAECLGAAIAISLLARVSLLAGMAVTACVTVGLLALQRRGYRPLEVVIGAFVAIIGVCYVGEVALAPPPWPAVGAGLVPRFPDGGAVMIAVGIVGATVMPHAIFLHSSLTQRRAPARNATERRSLVRFSNREVIVSLALAGAINVAMILMAARLLPNAGASPSLAAAYRTLEPLFGGIAGALFLLSLLAAGLSSSVVGTLAGQVIMQGFVGFAIPMWLRRMVTLAPAFGIVALRVDPTTALVFTQVILSLVLPVPMIALLVLSRRTDVMGAHRASGTLMVAAGGATALVLLLNAYLIVATVAPFV